MISVTLLTKNSDKHLQAILKMLVCFDEVLIYDNGSIDHTFEIASLFKNVRVIRGPFLGFGPTHNKASSLAKHEWIFSIDSDEIPTPELIAEIINLKLKPKTVYAISRCNEYRGVTIKGCGWSPDKVIRIYNKKETSFSKVQVHEKVLTENLKVVELQYPLKHYSYTNIHDFLVKMDHYSTLFAEQNKGKKSSSLCKALLHGFFAFFKSYIIKKGFLDRYPGYLISIYNAHTAFYKYLKLYEANLDRKNLWNELKDDQEVCGDPTKRVD